MQRKCFIWAPAVLFVLTGCEGTRYQQAYAVSEPTLPQIQGQCFAKHKKFMAQAECIVNAITGSGITLGPYTQEYLAYTQLLQEQVKGKKLSDGDARLKLAGKLNEQRTLQQNEFAVQQQLENQRAAQNAEILRQYQYKAPQLEMPQPRYTLPHTMQTNCSTIGTQVHCTSR